jgi:hypothetical protein
VENPYQVLGVGAATLRGRQNYLSLLRRRLEKPVPDHISVVGAKYIGKTVLLKTIAAQLSEDSHFCASVYWDLHRQTPESDNDFYRAFARQLARPLKEVNPELGDILHDVNSADFETIRLVIETLRDEGKMLLVILDGLDRPVTKGNLTRNLWDGLRALGELPSLRLVTGSSRRLRELCESPESRASEFWNIFLDPVHLTAFSKDELSDLFSPFDQRGITFAAGAQTEIMNWTGGMPILFCDLCRTIWDRAENGISLQPQQVNQYAEELFSQWPDYLSELWDECSAQERGILSELTAGKEFRPGRGYKQADVRGLIQRGYVQEDKVGLKSSCRAMHNFAGQYGADSTALYRLFGRSESYEQNIRSFLELRFLQIERADEQMRDCIRIALQNQHTPHAVIIQIRELINRAFTLIWEKELPDRRIPLAWTLGWKNQDTDGNPPERNPPEGRIPTSGAGQCYLLRLMVDPRKDGTTRVSRATYLLTDYLQSVGDFGAHRQGEQVPSGFFVAICLSAIELCDQLARDLEL